jgi:hypothetical protein
MAEDRATRYYPDDLQIDKFNLAEEWEHQPTLYMYWAEEAVYAQTQRDRVSEQLKLLAAQLDSDIRINWKAYGFPKAPTEGAIKAAIEQQESYMEKKEALAKATEHAKIMEAARSGMDHKRRALDNLTDLQIAGFYGANTAPPQHKVGAAVKQQAALADEVESKTKTPRKLKE